MLVLQPALGIRSRGPGRLSPGQLHPSSVLKDKSQVCLWDKGGEGSSVEENSACALAGVAELRGPKTQASSGCKSKVRVQAYV